MIELISPSPKTRAVKGWVEGVGVEDEAMSQLHNVSQLEIVGPHIAVMPDVHWGIGATVGSVIPTVKALIPSAVGVDIGCGMIYARLGVDANALDGKWAEIRHAIERTVPVGAGARNVGNHHEDKIPREALEAWNQLSANYSIIRQKHPKIQAHSPLSQLGTLGGGNHFIEVTVDQNGGLGVMLHSGSRGVGNMIGRYFISQAKEEMERLGVPLPDKDLAYLNEGTPIFHDYVDALYWAQKYARLNREVMLSQVLGQIKYYVEQAKLPFLPIVAANCHHNYVARETHFGQEMWITRKGAVRAKVGDIVIIPGSMGARSFIGSGTGNPHSFNSCSHGAGRKMSRGSAKRQFTKADLEAQTAGVECRKDEGVIDEIPGAYKDIEAVMKAQESLVTPFLELKQVICVKG